MTFIPPLLAFSLTNLRYLCLFHFLVHRWLRILDFSLFRTQGLRRTIGEGYDSRFVTANRLLALVTAAEGLTAFGASETMDSALSFEVLEALVGDPRTATIWKSLLSRRKTSDLNRTLVLLFAFLFLTRPNSSSEMEITPSLKPVNFEEFLKREKMTSQELINYFNP